MNRIEVKRTLTVAPKREMLMAKTTAKATKAKAKKAKKTSKKKRAPKALAAAAPTRCDQGGPEILPVVARISAGATVEFALQLCLASADVQVFLDTTRIADAHGQDEVRLRLPSMTSGVHSLTWSHITPSATWKTLAEVTANGVAIFRRRKSSGGSNPVNHGFLIMEVQP